MTEPSQAYALGLMANVQARLAVLRSTLGAARERATALEARLTERLELMLRERAALEAAEGDRRRHAAAVHEGNADLATLHQQRAVLMRRADELKAGMRREPEEVARQMRRERARLLVQLEDQEVALKARTQELEAARAALRGAEARVREHGERRRELQRDIDRLQVDLPQPHVLTEIVLGQLAAANCGLWLDGDVQRWRAQVRDAVLGMQRLHADLRAGRYRIDKHMDLLGGRSAATAEALYAAVAIGDADLALALFEVGADANLLMPEIVNVFRVWTLGLWLAGDRRALADLCERFRLSDGLHEAYARAWLGVVQRDPVMLGAGLKALQQMEWGLWSRSRDDAGVGIVCMAATAIINVARSQGIDPAADFPTVPRPLLTAASSGSALGR